MPIVAEGDEEPNNTYVEQLTASARAAVQVGPSPRPPAICQLPAPKFDSTGHLQPFETSTFKCQLPASSLD